MLKKPLTLFISIFVWRFSQIMTFTTVLMAASILYDLISPFLFLICCSINKIIHIKTSAVYCCVNEMELLIFFFRVGKSDELELAHLKRLS